MSIVIKLHAAVNAAVGVVAPIYGVSIGRKDDKATWRIDFKDEATAEQRAAAQAVVDGFDVQKELAQAELERKIDEIYSEAPFSQRALTELAWSLCAIRDIQEQQITALVNVIREIGGPSYASFDVPRVPDLKRNKGMVTVKDQIERTKALRAQKQ